MIFGVDEAGRGPLAGPVVAAAVWLNGADIAGLDDSKKLTERRREVLEQAIMAQCRWAVAEANVAEIDRLNILQATMLAITRAVDALVAALGATPEMVLVDGNRLPRWDYPARAIVGGDALEPCISAASILAKQHRDRLMRAADARHPGYGWASNKGYGSAAHLAALRALGPTPLHRRSFAPVAQLYFDV